MSEPSHIRWFAEPTLRRPVIVAAFTGWNDAGDAASSAIRHLVESWGARPLGEIDPEEFTDFATVRPLVQLDDGRTRNIVWPTVDLWHVSAPGGDVILALGPEPSLRWRLFTEQFLGLARRFDASMIVTLGALLADVPHTRPVQIIGTSSDSDLMDRFDLHRSRYEGPTGIVGVLQHACSEAGVPSASLWAAVPAYASQEPSPKAALALLERACDIIGTPTPRHGLVDDAEEYEQRIESLVESDSDLEGYVRRLELVADSGIDDDEDDQFDDSVGGELGEDDGEALVEEVERFLRDQRDD
jgi:predicted ATP-grasp superfamily ATP-dependent carboligase